MQMHLLFPSLIEIAAPDRASEEAASY